MSTITVTKTQTRSRSFSLSLVSARVPPLLRLPSELVLDILELALSETKPKVLATVSKAVSSYVETIVYRTVVLDSKDTINLFHRTTLSKSSNFLACHVKKLVLTWGPPSKTVQFTRLLDIVAACTGLCALVLPSGYDVDTIATILRAHRGNTLSEMIVHSHEGVSLLSMFYPNTMKVDYSTRASSITHLRICETSSGWVAPREMLDMFGTLPQLTHLELPRRIHANEDNDATFLEDIRAILRTRPFMKMLAVSVFPQSWSPPQDVCESSIWEMLSALRSEDRSAREALRESESDMVTV
ncbi:hypothetical protein K435DRAFT_816704 [Dendrothele bispora CBS 962.96]|uniref:F-box domain-containing protein n=1 Tax=Dendrothele bispora (strain CBS 962.96) TaxID=1314807 RepID=A0A4S8MS31_DENBC|nr:hypothetical protein K435DRAFT_816704 [Dendrothele bispora CBS 962.96]